MTLAATQVSVTVAGRPLLQSVSLALQPGHLHAVLGPNGAGKSTLLRLLAGERSPDQGEVTLAGRPLRDWSAAALARQRAVLPQQDELDFGFRVEEVVALGRLPCPRQAPAQERALQQQVLQATGALHLWGRAYPGLSGGERRRVQLARVLAQVWEPLNTGPRYLLLDEPTASLDLAHQHGCLAAARAFASQGNGVIAILHDPNLALAHADTVSLLHEGRVLASGTPAAVLTPARLREAFGIDAVLLQPEGWAHPWIATRGPPPLR
jgi:iron complex transport system ATP-binding protein